jgi:hypothetical protein
MQKQLVLSVLFLLFWFLAKTQPAQFFFGGAGNDHITQIRPLSDGNFMAVGSKEVGNIQRIWLLKIDQNGAMIWEKTFPQSSSTLDTYGYNLMVLSDGSIIVVGEERLNQILQASVGIVIKTDAEGNQIWLKKYNEMGAVFDVISIGNDLLLAGTQAAPVSSFSGFILSINEVGTILWTKPITVSDDCNVRKILPTNDGNYVLVGRANAIGAGFSGIFLRKITPLGITIWQKTKQTGWTEDDINPVSLYYNQPIGVELSPDGSIWISDQNYSGLNNDITLIHYDPLGNLIEQRNYGDPDKREVCYGLTLLPDGALLIVGESLDNSSTGLQIQGFAIKADSSSNEVWRRYYSSPDESQRFLSVISQSDYLLMVGMSNHASSNGQFDGWVLRTELDGNELPWAIEGQVLIDVNNNCQADTIDIVAKDWFLNVENTTTSSIITDNSGKFRIRTESGPTTLTALAPHPTDIWQFCANNITVNTGSNNPLAQITFLAQSADGGCPHTEVSITQPDLVRCSTSTYIVTVQNRGAGASGDLLLNIVTDPALTIESASEPYAQNGNSIEFEIPPMDMFEQKNITVKARLTCNVQIGATHAIDARLTPVECAIAWTGPRFALEGNCSGNEVVFSLKNEGSGGVNASSRYRVISDDLLYSDWTDVLLSEGSTPSVLSFPADGRTWRVELEQALGYPQASHPAVSIEGCGVGDNGLYAIAHRHAWRYDDGNPDVAAVLAPNTTGVPDRVVESSYGFGQYNFVSDTGWLEYTARVRNHLNEVLNKVEYRLAFSPTLDIRTFQVLSSNEPVDIELGNDYGIKATMDNIQIDTGAYAMLRFRILPFGDTPPDSSSLSLFTVDAKAYLNNQGPFSLKPGYFNLSKTYSVFEDAYSNYPREVLDFGGRSADLWRDAKQGPDSSVFIVGGSISYSARTNHDGLIIKANKYGQARWLNAVDPGDQGYNVFWGVEPLQDGGCIAVGNYSPPNATSIYLDAFSMQIVRFDSSGNIVWQKIMRPTGPQFGVWASGILTTIDGNFFIYGYSERVNNSVKQLYLKINQDGDIIWMHYQPNVQSAFMSYSAVLTDDGGFVIMGAIQGTPSIYLEKIDPNGNKLWTQLYNHTNTIELGGLAIMPDGGFLLSGTSYTLNAAGEARYLPIFIRFSSAGNFEWEKTQSIDNYRGAYSYDLIQAPDGGFFSVGEILLESQIIDYDILLIKLDESADLQWWRKFGTTNYERAYKVLSTSINQLLLCGHNAEFPPLYNRQALVVRTDANGNLFVNTNPEPVRSNRSVVVSPNPTYDRIHVSLQQVTASQPIQWQITDPRGIVHRTGSTVSDEFDINLGSVSGGMYFLTFPHQNIPAKRVVVVR